MLHSYLQPQLLSLIDSENSDNISLKLFNFVLIWGGGGYYVPFCPVPFDDLLQKGT